MRKVTYQTKGGSTVVLAIETETPNLADHNVTNRCWELSLTVNDKPIMGGIDRIDHPQHGPCLKPYFGGLIITIPAGKVADVDSLINEYSTVRDARAAATKAVDDKYDADHAAVLRMMDQ